MGVTMPPKRRSNKSRLQKDRGFFNLWLLADLSGPKQTKVDSDEHFLQSFVALQREPHNFQYCETCT